MSAGQGQIEPGGSAEAAWHAVRRGGDIQFSPLAPMPERPPTPPPGWLEALLKALEALFKPIGRLLGMSWPVFQYVLIGGAALLVLFIVWRAIQPLLARRADSGGEQEAGWAPVRAEAEALLSDADRLAAEGRFDEATHLLLVRSVRQIGDARPDALHPASTAREIARLSFLPAIGREAFTTIAVRVERSLFALRALDAEDWGAARAAYARFAQVGLPG
ncbi:hypothetical protein ACFSTD_18945 [Novosphingobium colocasiae]|uniref:DUF4129 domain-containing protein n=1 Tax=Novosphingobium colocasiae TaxID=1256513 RepID=A0A918P8M5_9SPHN|nr:hypothetical protein [Novosphingobium colocasiae]GGY91205.1 hypothetical protein GCM10011614_02350 [Novosphingobium colocasiae]